MVNDLDSILTASEKRKLDRARGDIASKKGSFVPVEKLQAPAGRR